MSEQEARESDQILARKARRHLAEARARLDEAEAALAHITREPGWALMSEQEANGSDD